MAIKVKAVFADMDDTLIKPILGATFPMGVWDMKFKFGVLDQLKSLPIDYILIVSNQAGIAQGKVDEVDFRDKIRYVATAIKEYTGKKCLFKYCGTSDKNSRMRKPNTGMLDDFAKELSLNKEESVMIGDASGLQGQFSDSDKKTAENFGIKYFDVDSTWMIKDYIFRGDINQEENDIEDETDVESAEE